jgi:hypothetical protein
MCHLLALLGAHHILHVSRIRVKPTRAQMLKLYFYAQLAIISTCFRLSWSSSWSYRTSVKQIQKYGWITKYVKFFYIKDLLILWNSFLAVAYWFIICGSYTCIGFCNGSYQEDVKFTFWWSFGNIKNAEILHTNKHCYITI